MQVDTHGAVLQAGNSLRSQATKTKGANDGSEKANNKSLGKQDFLNLMMTQMSHQDPMNPTDSNQMMQQMATLGTVEQLQNLNAKMDQLSKIQGDMLKTSSYALLGKDVELGSNHLKVTKGASAPVSYAMEGDVEKVSISIFDSEGRKIRNVEEGPRRQGEHTFHWDGKDDEGDPVSDGSYRYEVRGKTNNGDPVTAKLFKTGRVSNIEFKGGRPTVTVNGESLPLDVINGVSDQSEKRFDVAAPMGIKKELSAKKPVGLEASKAYSQLGPDKRLEASQPMAIKKDIDRLKAKPAPAESGAVKITL